MNSEFVRDIVLDAKVGHRSMRVNCDTVVLYGFKFFHIIVSKDATDYFENKVSVNRMKRFII